MPLFAIPFPVVDPIALELGPLVVRWYALAYIAGLLLGWWLAKRICRSEALWGSGWRPKADDVDDLIVFVAFGVIIGGRLGYVLLPYGFSHYVQNPIDALKIWHGGMSFHGGLVGAAVAVWLYAKRRAEPALPLFDLACSVAPIGLFFGRLANFINAELYGRVADVPWAMVFPNGGPDPRHPSQLYQAALEGISLFVIGQILVRSGALKRPGLVSGVFVAGYGIARVIGELFREPDAQLGYYASGLTMGMILSLPMIPLGLWLIARARRREPVAG